MAKLAHCIQSVKTNLSQFLPDEVIQEATRKSGHQFRQRKLGPVQTVLLLILQVLAANASLAEVRARDGRRFCVSALAQARLRLPVAILQHVLQWLVDQCQTQGKTQGPRVILVDAFNSYLPDVPQLSEKFNRPGQQRRGNHYPQSRSLAVFDLETGLLLSQHEFASNRHESPQLKHILEVAKPGDILVCDRGFVSYANLVMLMQHNILFIARLASGMRARRKTNRLIRRRLGKKDHEVVWKKPSHAPKGFDPNTCGNWDDLPKTITLRQVQHRVSNPAGRCRQLTLITSLMDAKAYPPEQIAAHYARRWEVEIDIRHMKQTLNLEFFKTKSKANHQRELLLRAIAYNLVRLVMVRAALIMKCPSKQVSFSDACRWIQSPHSPDTLCKLLKNPLRTRTSRPRKIKYRGKNFRTMTEKSNPQTKVA